MKLLDTFRHYWSNSGKLVFQASSKPALEMKAGFLLSELAREPLKGGDPCQVQPLSRAGIPAAKC